MVIKIDPSVTVVFDLDDTLYKEVDFLRSAYVEIAQFLDKKNWLNLYTYMFALYREKQNVFEMMSATYDVEINNLITCYREHVPQINLAEGAEELMRCIKLKKGNIAILTDGRKNTQENKINALGLRDTIDKAFISEELGTEKPDPNNFIAIENHFKSKRYFYIGDNLKKDFISANARKWNTIALIDNGLNVHYTSQYHKHEGYLPQHFIKDFKDLRVE